MTEAIEGRVFLVGCPRSGTTLLQSLIAAHPQIASFPETHFLVAASKTRWSRWCTRLGIALPVIRERLEQFLVEIGHHEMQALVPRSGHLVRQYADAFARILDQLTLSQGKTHWLEKTPGHLHYIGLFERYIQNAQFIHIVRNGPDVIASLYEVTHRYPQNWGGAYDIDHCIARWNYDVRLTQRYLCRANHILVRYEQLAESPVAVLRDACAFIDVPFRRDMIERRRLAIEGIVLADETWKQGVEQDIRRGYSKFERTFGPKQRVYILERLVPIKL